MDKPVENSNVLLTAKPLMAVPNGLVEQTATGESIAKGLQRANSVYASPAAVSSIIGELIGSLPITSPISTIAQVAIRARAIANDHEPIWFVNFPPNLSSSEKVLLQEYMQEVLNFRSWSSLKWWAEVFTRIPSNGTVTVQIQQSSEFARITEAVRDVQDGKNSSHQEVRCDMSYTYYEAQFMMNTWRSYSASVDKQQKEACQDFVERQTIDVPP
ncbi:hypothetical protein J4E91_000913 [Alternaria rosae]|nr:hypothetical protein J4E91_000913 [Alternaria rosae]